MAIDYSGLGYPFFDTRLSFETHLCEQYCWGFNSHFFQPLIDYVNGCDVPAYRFIPETRIGRKRQNRCRSDRLSKKLGYVPSNKSYFSISLTFNPTRTMDERKTQINRLKEEIQRVAPHLYFRYDESAFVPNRHNVHCAVYVKPGQKLSQRYRFDIAKWIFYNTAFDFARISEIKVM